MKTLRVVIAALVVGGVVVVGGTAYADSPHFKKGGSPACTVTGPSDEKTVTCTGSLAGLGNGDLIITTTVGGSATFLCGSPGNENLAPGQNKTPLSQSEPTVIPGGSIKNGTVTFTTTPTTIEAPEVTAEEAGCPNKNWHVVGATVLVTSISMVIEQGGQTLFTCGASNPQGLTGTVRLTC